MNVSLTPELEGFINEQVCSGGYASPSEVVREGLRLLQEQAELRQTRRAELQRDIARGLASLERGDFQTFSSATALVEYIKTAGRQRQRGKR